MERYSEYKDSGVDYMSLLPSLWKAVQIGHIFDIKAGGDVKPEFFSDTKDYSHPFPVYTNTKSADDIYAYTCYPTCKANTITVTGRGEVGHAIFRSTPYDAIVRLLSLSPKAPKYDSKFYAYVIDTIIPFTSDSAAIGQLSAVQIKPKYVPLPPLPEQQAIVAFLDGKCGKIDRLIENKRKELDMLQEMKQRIIADAVTRGLDPSVNMKPTGISWLPQIPEHWEIRKMKYLFDERSEKNHPDEPILSATQTEGVILQSKYKNRVVVVNTGFEGLKLVKVGDFVIHLRSFQGGIEIAYDQGIISSAYTVLKPRITEYSPYYKHLFKSSEFIDLLKTCVTGIREGQNINYFKLKQYMLPIPPISEQRAIVSHINSRVEKIDTLASKLQQEIDNIKEYKQRLISDIVTGQIKVC